MLYSYACMIPNVIAYDIYKPLIIELSKSADPLHRKAGLKILGFVCDSDGLLDPIKNDIDLWTDLIVESLQHPDQIVKDATCQIIGNFSEDCVPDFLDQHAKVMPVLTNVLQSQVQIAVQSEEHASSAERALFALGEFATNFEEYELKPYLASSIQIILAYL